MSTWICNFVEYRTRGEVSKVIAVYLNGKLVSGDKEKRVFWPTLLRGRVLAIFRYRNFISRFFFLDKLVEIVMRSRITLKIEYFGIYLSDKKSIFLNDVH